MSLAEHGVGLANTRGRAQVDTEMAGRLDLAGGVRVHRRGVAHAFAGTLGAGDHCLLGDLGGLPLHRSPLWAGAELARSGRRVTDCQLAAIHSGSAFDGTTGARPRFGSLAELRIAQMM